MSAAAVGQTGSIPMPNYQVIEETAEGVLAEFHIDAVPVNPIQVAKALGYEVYASRFADPNFSGRIVVNDGSVRIDVNASDAPNRRRFTIAHEIGHALLHAGGEDLQITDRVSDRDVASRELAMAREVRQGLRPVIEAEADRFAAALLMPRAVVQRKFAERQNVTALALIFQVSVAAMDIRLKQLGLTPATA